MKFSTKPQDHGVRVIRGFENQRPGAIIFPTAMYREALLRGRWVEVVVPEIAEVTEDIPASPVDRAMSARRRR